MPSNFAFLEEHHPKLYQLACYAENRTNPPDHAVQSLRQFAEGIVECLYEGFCLNARQYKTFKDRISAGSFTSKISSPGRTALERLRVLGNRASHFSSKDKQINEEDWLVALKAAHDITAEYAFLLSGTQIPDFFNPLASAVPSNGPIRSEEQPAEPVYVGDGEFHPKPSLPEIEKLAQSRLELAEFIEGAELNAGQRKAADALQAFLRDANADVFVLRGYAGTGKTFLMKAVTAYLIAMGTCVELAAPTGKAARVLTQATGHVAVTLHLLIYQISLNLKKCCYEGILRTNTDSDDTVYIVDESSMVSDGKAENADFKCGSGHLLADLFSFVRQQVQQADQAKPSHRKIIFVGDPAQLPPINMAESAALSSDYLGRAYSATVREAVLDEVVRQASGSSVLAFATSLRKQINSANFLSLEPEKSADGLICPVPDRDSLLDKYKAVTNGRINPDETIYITHSNDQAFIANRAIHQWIYGSSDTLESGDVLVVTHNCYGPHRFFNGQFCVVHRVLPETRESRLIDKPEQNLHVQIDTVDVELETDTESASGIVRTKIVENFLFSQNAVDSKAFMHAQILEFVRRNPRLNDFQRNVLMRRDPWFNALWVRFGYAITCHKAQGSGWKQVFADCTPPGNPRCADYYRWLYTAVTRTKSTLYECGIPSFRPGKIRVVGGRTTPSNSNSLPEAGCEKPVRPAVMPDAEPPWDDSNEPEISGGQQEDGTGPVEPEQEQAANSDAALQSGYEIPEDFVRAAVQEAAERQGAHVVSVISQQYCYSATIEHDGHRAEIRLFYNGREKFSSIRRGRASNWEFAEHVCEELQSLIGKNIHGEATTARAPTAPTDANPEANRAFSDIFEQKLASIGAKVVSRIQLTAYQCRWSITRGEQQAAIDIYTKKNGEMTASPITTHSSQLLIDDILDMMDEEMD